MKCILLLFACLLSLPAEAEEAWQFEVDRAVLLWGDGRQLAPVEAGLLPEAQAEASTGPSIEVEALAPNQWRVMRRDAPGAGLQWDRVLSVDAVPTGSGRPLNYYSTIEWRPRFVEGGRGWAARGAGDIVLVLGEGALIVAIDAATGLVRWQVNHIWEYVRAQEPPPNFNMEMRRVRGRGERARLLEEARVVVGPLVVPNEEGGYRVFVGVTEARRHETATPIHESRVYELSAWGSVDAVVRLPRALATDSGQSHEGGVLLQMEEGALARIEPSFQQRGGWRGSGGTDRVVRTAWYVEPTSPAPVETWPSPRVLSNPDAWLRTAGLPSTIAVAGPHLVQARAGAHADKPDDGAWTFPLRRLHVGTRQFVDVDLRVPFRGTVPPPQTNFSAGNVEDGPKQYDAFTRHEAWLEDISIHEGHLALDVRMKGGAEYRWRFALPDVKTQPDGPSAEFLPPAAPLLAEDPTPPVAVPTLEELVRPGWPEPRVMDPDALVAPFAVPERAAIERLVALALAPSPLQRAALRAIRDLPPEASDLLPLGDLAALFQGMERVGMVLDYELVLRLADEAPQAARLCFAEIQLRTHDHSTRLESSGALHRLGEKGRELLYRAELDEVRNSNETWLGGFAGPGDDDAPELHQEWWRKMRKHLQDADPRLRAAAAWQLAADVNPDAREGTFESTQALLRSAYIPVRSAGAELAGGLARDGRTDGVVLARSLSQALDTPDLDVVGKCLDALGDLGAGARAETAAIHRVVRSGNPENRPTALYVLGSVASPDDAPTIALLEEYVASEDPELAEAAKHALERLR